MRLSSKIFVALAVLAGSLFGFTPDASAHMNTESVAVVSGTVLWPAGPLGDFDLPRGLNGCLLPTGNTNNGLAQLDTALRAADPDSGLPVGPALADGETNHDLCFKFVQAAISSAGKWNGQPHQTNLECEATGTTGASGVNPNPGALGASYGEFECDIPPDDPITPTPEPGLDPLPAFFADGHFHLLSKATTVAFLGVINQCNVDAPGTANDCDPAGGGPPPSTTFPNARYGKKGPSVLKHTVACKGEVVPDPLTLVEKGIPFHDKDGDGVPDKVLRAHVELECVIA